MHEETFRRLGGMNEAEVQAQGDGRIWVMRLELGIVIEIRLMMLVVACWSSCYSIIIAVIVITILLVHSYAILLCYLLSKENKL